ncbi:hypothetical protein L1987_35701 [Smallanthus sonchifolius]|uniref:Uncharacterized protein n=1 Tax=Smallanthus sonchifolius TaxID=185202 RepID=A0ACB9HB48_9ASTR|nr:hypothetical protein L1987_35701 [Smallanthus sonchifolius]
MASLPSTPNNIYGFPSCFPLLNFTSVKDRIFFQTLFESSRFALKRSISRNTHVHSGFKVVAWHVNINTNL